MCVLCSPFACVLTVLVLEQVKDRQDLSVVRHERLADHLSRHDQLLEHLEHLAHDLVISRVERGLDRDDELRDDGEDLGTALREQIVGALTSEELVRLLLLADAVEEDREVVVVVELVEVDLPLDLSLGAVERHLQRQIAAIVEPTKLRLLHDLTHGIRTGGRRLQLRDRLGSGE